MIDQKIFLALQFRLCHCVKCSRCEYLYMKCMQRQGTSTDKDILGCDHAKVKVDGVHGLSQYYQGVSLLPCLSYTRTKCDTAHKISCQLKPLASVLSQLVPFLAAGPVISSLSVLFQFIHSGNPASSSISYLPLLTSKQDKTISQKQ